MVFGARLNMSIVEARRNSKGISSLKMDIDLPDENPESEKRTRAEIDWLNNVKETED